MTERIIHEYEYNGRNIGRIIEYTRESFLGTRTNPRTGGEEIVREKGKSRGFQCDLSEGELREILEEMPIGDKIHMKSRVYGLYAALGLFGVEDDREYITDEELGMYVRERGFNTLTELNHGDHRAWHMVKSRGLEKVFFPADAVLEEFQEIKEVLQLAEN